MTAGVALGGYFGLFMSAFLAATLLPLSSEAVLAHPGVTGGGPL